MKGTSIIVAIIGFIFLAIGGYWIYSTISFQQNGIKIEGTVIEMVAKRDSDGDTMYSPVVSFQTQEGREITIRSSSSSNPPMYSVGDQATVYYMKDNPSKNYISNFVSDWLFGLIFGGIGLVMLLAIAITQIVLVKKAKTANHLKAAGIKIQAAFQEVTYNTTLQVNGKSPYRIVCQWLNPQDNTLFIFESANIWFNPTDYIDRQHIDVYVQPGNFKKYTMDTSFLPKLA